MRKQVIINPTKTMHKYRHQNRNITYLVNCNNLLLFITSILKKLVILASWLALSKMIYLQTAQYFGLKVWRSSEQTRWQVAATDPSVCTCRATSRRITLQWHITVTNPFKRLSLQQNFFTATSPTNSVWFDFLRHAAATKFCYRDKDFHNNSSVHTKWFVTVMCRCDTLLQLVI